jgi:hypothetical protein
VVAGAAALLLLTETGSTRARPLEGPVTVAVIDTGVNQIAALRGAVDWELSHSLVSGEDLADPDGHGTTMATLVHRAAPDARIIAVKALDDQGGTTDDALAHAIGYSTSAGAAVISLSVAGAQRLPATRTAIARAGAAGVLVVVAAGNDGADIDHHPSYPAAYRLDNLVAVGVTDPAGKLLPSSNYGSTVIPRAPATGVETCSGSDVEVAASSTSAVAALTSGDAAVLLAEGHRAPGELRLALSRTAAGSGDRDDVGVCSG